MKAGPPDGYPVDPDDTLTNQRDEDIVKYNRTRTLRGQGSPVRLLMQLLTDHPELPAAEFHMSAIYPDRLDVSVHDDMGAFEAWREALGLARPIDRTRDRMFWVVIDGLVDDVPVRLTGFASEALVEEYMAADDSERVAA
ncbi:hypothetical protein ACFY8V_32650 [Streptomyces californicus]|uniref:hypothetical protein n=1 Tax=Streptomyces californicus TaxID=67351 RepID=UPI0036828396